ncbi:MAG: hypothetical protein DSY58_04490 [Desulfobulbus sp.]|nr:MAG: hypothetical protein DSY58_04490 [Desulfobulbus sp.]RUM40496.1 MAG: hypothetical protein DSY70_03410 [Desulfobulbus sp.]
MKKIQIGARISPEDADFLNLLEINGAKTPSDKLRAIIEEARLRREYSHEFTGSYRMIQEQLAPIIERIKQTEFEQNIHSAPLARILDWLPEFYAYCLCSLPETIESEQNLQMYEKGAVDRVARLFESLLHLELSVQGTTYNSGVLKEHIASLSETMKIIEHTSHITERKK